MGMLRGVSAACAVLVLAAAGAQAEEWKLAKDEDGIQVYLNSVPGSKYKAYRGVTLIKADMASLRKLQEDVAGSCAWIHECREQKSLKAEGDKHWTYTRFSTPWPVTPRDSVMEVTTEEGADGSITRHLKGVPTYVPEEKGFVRVSKVEGIWKFTPKADGQVEALYQVHTEPGGSIPSWLANSFVVDAPYLTLEKLRALAEKR